MKRYIVSSYRAFICPACHNPTLNDVDRAIYKNLDVDYHDKFVCDECGAEYLAEPRYDGTVKFVAAEIEDFKNEAIYQIFYNSSD